MLLGIQVLRMSVGQTGLVFGLEMLDFVTQIYDMSEILKFTTCLSAQDTYSAVACPEKFQKMRFKCFFLSSAVEVLIFRALQKDSFCSSSETMGVLTQIYDTSFRKIILAGSYAGLEGFEERKVLQYASVVFLYLEFG